MRLLCVCVALALGSYANAQFEVYNQGQTPEELILENLIGEGVEILSITYDGDDQSIGAFRDGTNTGGHPNGLGVENGLLMTNGAAELVSSRGVGNGDESQDMSYPVGNGANAVTHPNLIQLVDSADRIRDYSVIKIQFIPETDTFRLNYIWASEEYPLFVCSEFNDQFGFIITGPGITGNYNGGTGKNIALIPNTDLTVTINSLNSGTPGLNGSPSNCSPEAINGETAKYFIDNLAFGTEARPAFNGYSTVLEAKSAVIPCETYTIELLIADLGDDSQDSGVFFEKGSFRTNAMEVLVSTPNLDNTIAEGCGSASIDLNANNQFNIPIPLQAEIKGSATLGVDYTLTVDGTVITDASELVLPTSQERMNFEVQAIQDNVAEGTERIVITYRSSLYINPEAICTDKDSVVIFIRDNELRANDLPDTLHICGEGSKELDGSITNVILQGKKYGSNGGADLVPEMTEVVSNILVFGEEQSAVGQNDLPVVCIDVTHPNPKDLDIFLESPDGKVLELVTGVGADFEANFIRTCFTPDATTSITAGASPYTGEFLPEGDFSSLVGAVVNGEWKLKIIDTQTGVTGRLDAWSIEFTNPYSVDYRWSPDQDISSITEAIVEVSPTTSTLYKLEIQDIYLCTVEDSTYINVAAGYTFEADTTHVSCFGDNTGAITLTSSDPFVQYNWSTGEIGGIRRNISAGVYEVTLVGQSGCEQVETFTITEPEELTYTSTIQDATCQGSNDGSIEVTPDGGVTPYMISWSEVSSNSFVLSDLGAGTYTAVLSDANDCEVNISREIEEKAPYTVQSEVLNLTCHGEADGTIQISVGGNSAPITYQWTGPGGFTSTSPNLSDLPAGDYMLLITEEEGCKTERSFSLSEPDKIVLDHQSRNVMCNGENNGSITLLASGGTAPLEYSIDNGDSYLSESRFDMLTAGDYSILVQDANGCKTAANNIVSISQPDLVTIDLPSLYDIVFGESVTITATPSIGQDGITNISWSPSEDLSCATCLETSTTPELSTNYTLTIVDTVGCAVSKTTTVRVDRSPRVEMPNIFAPNGDRQNSRASLVTDDVIVQEIESFRIFDRWGSLVYEVSNIEPNGEALTWDGRLNGKLVESGVYVWVASIKLQGNESKMYSGDVTVVK